MYQYQSLNFACNEIRLLVLIPGPEESQIKGLIFKYARLSAHSSLSYISEFEKEIIAAVKARGIHDGRFTGYDALSYEWGDINSPRHEILLNGDHLEIRENLFQALLSLRSRKMTRPLWVDAICINQEDVQERDHQVRMMSSIYNSAISVRVWLGYNTTAISDAFQLIPYILTAYSLEDLTIAENRRLVCRFLRGHIPYSNENLFKSDNNKDFTSDWEELFLVQNKIDFWDDHLMSTMSQKGWWEALARFLEQSYWTRIWIVQEYLLARNIIIYCGRKAIDSRYLDMALNSIDLITPEQYLEYPPYFKEITERINNSVGKGIIESRRRSEFDATRNRTRRRARTLFDLIEKTRRSRCHDPHDRIYAIMGLADEMWTASDSIPIDYDRSIFKVKMDIVCFMQRSKGFNQDDVSQMCLLLDEIFADCPDSYYEA